MLKIRSLLISWAAAWPTITALLFALEGIFETWPLALKTMVLTGIMVSLLALLLVPKLERLFQKLLQTGRAKT